MANTQVEDISGIVGKEVAAANYMEDDAGYPFVLIVFTDGSSIRSEEISQSGAMRVVTRLL